MYDPEEACNENEATQEVKTESQDQDDKWAEVDVICSKEKTEEQVIQIKIEDDEEETKAVANSPRTRRAVAVKNGTGPKAKRGRK